VRWALLGQVREHDMVICLALAAGGVLGDAGGPRGPEAGPGQPMLLLSGGTGADVLAHDVSDPAAPRALGALAGHKLAVAGVQVRPGPAAGPC
jgi:hypothetical protein